MVVAVVVLVVAMVVVAVVVVMQLDLSSLSSILVDILKRLSGIW